MDKTTDKILKRKNLRQRPTACSSRGPPDCLGEAELASGSRVCSTAPGSRGRSGWEVVNVGKAHSQHCAPLSKWLGAASLGQDSSALLQNQG